MSPENKKIALIVGALLVVSFLNFQVNDYNNLTAQTSSGAIDWWYGFLRPKKYQEPKINELPLDPTSIASGKNSYFKKRRGKYFILYYVPENYYPVKYPDNLIKDILSISDSNWEDCLKRLECPLSDINRVKRGKIIIYPSEELYNMAGGIRDGCYMRAEGAVLLNRPLGYEVVANRLLPHEIWHSASNYSCSSLYFSQALSEGLAILREPEKYINPRIKNSAEAHQSDMGKVYSISELLSSDYPQFRDPIERGDFYDQGTSLAKFLTEHLGSEKAVVDFGKNREFNNDDLKQKWYKWEERFVPQTELKVK